ncbi:CsiV family protein [Thalassotalea psychrophila]|uniref:CsiV family protein n=1 Tax=Thalassotalea psychrophila TaxID=3065647 RepID=A0ABY9TXS9_9GAMM|nr:CsiV family protein [Colwelliaceae bacterium SQ149]
MQVNNAMTTVRTNSSITKHKFTKLAKLALLSSMLFSLVGHNAIAQPAKELKNTDATEKPAERWFEIEVILLEQLIDKSSYKEDFKQQVALNNDKASNNVSLLNNYLQNIVNFEQQLDVCNTPKTIAVNNSIDNLEQEGFQATEQTKNKTTLAEVEKKLANLSLACKKNDVNIFENAIDKEFYQIPKTISANEDLYANVPYLLNKNSLKLTHIKKSLSNSKHFKPVLHMGWRQAVLDRRAAKAVRLLAGENQALTKVKNTEVIELDENLQLSDAEKQDIVTKHLAQIINDIEQNDIQIDVLTEQIKNQQIQPLFDVESLTTAENNTKQHQQNWQIDGFFNVHLDHYLYINSQFNVIAKSKNNNEKVIEALVPFKQNRRVISGEIHYFDHPYMGMIVQIRRHEKPDVIDEDAPKEVIDSEELDINSDRN